MYLATGYSAQHTAWPVPRASAATQLPSVEMPVQGWTCFVGRRWNQKQETQPSTTLRKRQWLVVKPRILFIHRVFKWGISDWNKIKRQMTVNEIPQVSADWTVLLFPSPTRKAKGYHGGGASFTSTLKKSSPQAAQFYRFQTHPLWETHFLNPSPSSQRSATGPCGIICPLTVHPSTVVRGRMILESNAPGCTHWCVRRPLDFPLFPARG